MPVKSVNPSMAGTWGRLSWPHAATTTSASTVSPSFVRRRQVRVASSKVADAISVDVRRWRCRP